MITEDFFVYQQVVAEMRARHLDFITPSLGETIPINVGAIITTETEQDKIDFDANKIVVARKASAAVDQAQRLLNGARKYDEVIIGIDPGNYPGVAVIGGGAVISVHQVSIGAVAKIVNDVLGEQSARNVIVRIGHGARLVRARIVNTLLELGVRVELVDESFTTPHLGKGVRGQTISDIVAAINIANLEGIPVKKQQIIPTKGEIRVIQEHSREKSNGRYTIPRKLAQQVAKGELTLDEAILCYNGASDDK